MVAEKIAADKIYLHRVEGDARDIQTVILSSSRRPDVWLSATEALRRWALTAPDDRDGHKVDYEITFADGALYKGALLLCRRHVEDADLTQESLQSLFFYAGRWQPEYLTPAQYQQFLSQNEEKRHQATEMLAAYDFGAEFCAPPPAATLSLLGPDPRPEDPPARTMEVVNVSCTAQVVGFDRPVLMTVGVWELIVRAHSGGVEERLRDVLEVARVAAKALGPGAEAAVPFRVMLAVGESAQKVNVPFRVAPGQNEGGQVFAIMRVDD